MVYGLPIQFKAMKNFLLGCITFVIYKKIIISQLTSQDNWGIIHNLRYVSIEE